MAKRMKIRKPRLPHIRKKKRKIKNDVPGTLTYTGNKAGSDIHIEVIDYSTDYYQSLSSTDVTVGFNKMASGHISWINVNGLNSTDQIEQLGLHYNLHPLTLEDIVDTNQRPKLDEFPDYLFVVFKMLYFNKNEEFVNEHISLVLGHDYVLTFQESDGDVFDSLRQRIAHAKGRIRTEGADYLMFAIMDAVVDNYFILIEHMSDKIEQLEDDLFLNHVEEDITQDIQDLKREVLRVRKAVYPFREVVSRLEKQDASLIDERTFTYIRDLYDHVVQVYESIEVYREMTWGLMDMYMTTISNKMNEVMKVLTIMASIFIPLTFMAGLYGMNFKYMPELQFKYGYFYLLGAMAIVCLGLIWYFKRKKWL
ncbi:MAG: magnesium/cobalt transporter CorA [Leeuwenhoekiella sp.]